MKTPAYTPEQSSWKETRHVHPKDEELRSCGFHIVARPRHGPVLWMRWEDGRWKHYTQADAEATLS